MLTQPQRPSFRFLVRPLLAILLFVLSSRVSGLEASLNLIQNGSFETSAPHYQLVPGNSSYPPGWRTLLNGVEIFTSTDIGVGSPHSTTIQDGVTAVDLAPYLFTGGGIQQSFATIPGFVYQVSFWAGTERAWGKTGVGNVVARVESGGSVLTELHYPLQNTSSDILWEQKTFDYVATGVSSTLSFLSFDDASRHMAAIDNIMVQTINVPEPPMVCLAALALAMSSLSHIRKRLVRS